MDNSIYNGTMAILKDFSYTEDGMDFKMALTIEAAYCYSANRGKDYPIIKYFLRLFLPIKNICFFDALKSNEPLFTCAIRRRDYFELIQAAKKNVTNSRFYYIDELFKRRFSLPRLYYYKVLKSGCRFNIGFRKKLYLAFKLLDYVIAYRTLKSTGASVSCDFSYKYIPFNSSTGLENIITQYLNSRGCRTFHLCHGLHFSPNYRFWSVDAFNKELIAAQIVLSWGRGFVDNDKKLYRHNYFHEVVGNPKYPAKNIDITFSTDKCIVLLARGQYDKNNYRLLSLLSAYSKFSETVFYIKPHPTDNILELRKRCDEYNFVLIDDDRTIRELLLAESFGFAISYETTAYFEAMYYNLICFRYSYEENEAYGNFDDRFINEQELSQQVKKYALMDTGKLNKKIAQCLRYEIGMGINRYAEVLE